jgi:hypothetical protein
MEGATQEQTYVLWPDAPPVNGVLVKGDGDGSTRNYRVQTLSGPLYTLSQACAQTQVPRDALRSIGCVVQESEVQRPPSTSVDQQPVQPSRQRQKVTLAEFFKRMLKLIGGGAIIIAILAFLGAIFGPAKPEPAKPPQPAKPPEPGLMIMAPEIGGTGPPSSLEPSGNVTPTFMTKWPEQAESELQILIDENLRAAGHTALEFMDETDMRKVGSGMAEVLNILDELEARAARGELTNAQAQAGILGAFKHLGLDFLRAANLVAFLKTLASLGASGISALRKKLAQKTAVARTAIEAGLATEAEIVDEIVKRGGTDLNNIKQLEADLGCKLKVRGGKGKFPIVDAIDDGFFSSIATSEQEGLSYLEGKYKILFEGEGYPTTHANARELLATITGKRVTELSFQKGARLIVSRAKLPEMQAFIRDRVKQFYMNGGSGSALADSLVKSFRAKGLKGDALVKAVTDQFLKRVVGR